MRTGAANEKKTVQSTASDNWCSSENKNKISELNQLPMKISIASENNDEYPEFNKMSMKISIAS